MSQDPNRQSSYKRSNRSARNRPVLVNTTSNDSTTTETTGQNIQDAPQAPETKAPVEEASTPVTSVPRTRRLPQFFSSVSKDENAQETKGGSSPNFLARKGMHLRSRLTRTSTSKVSPAPSKQEPTDKKPEGRSTEASPTPARSTPGRSTPARGKSGFKLRYIYGILLYLIAADFLGVFETNYLRANHIDSLLFSIGPYPITISTITYLATLVIVLVALAYFDLIPRNLGALGGSTSSQGRSGQASSTTETGKQRPPTMKQGVQGEDDDLYQEYRTQQRYNQRRGRKR